MTHQRTHYSGRTAVPLDKEATQGKHLLDLLKKTEVNVLFNDILTPSNVGAQSEIQLFLEIARCLRNFLKRGHKS